MLHANSVGHTRKLQRRAASEHDLAQIEHIWQASQQLDDPAFRPRTGWWSLSGWAKDMHLLAGHTVIGVIALNGATDGATEVRLALDPAARTPATAHHLVTGAMILARKRGAQTLRLYLPSAAAWALEIARAHGFALSRSFHAMQRPASAAPFVAPVPDGISIRPIRSGEDDRVLAALNRAWADTWNFHPLTLDALERDLAGQREGFLVAVDTASARIAGTVHAIFDPTVQQIDGTPFAWISNLTTVPAWRGKGLGRALLAAGMAALLERGAVSLSIGVDGGNTIALALYRAAGFVTVSRLDVWERAAA